MKKKIITALGVNLLNLKLKEINEIEVIGNDIPYQDGVLDILKGNSEINSKILKTPEETNDNFELGFNKLNNIIDNSRNEKKPKMYKETKVIAISGNYGTGKSILTSLLGQAGRRSKLKTIIIDFDIINNSINTIFRVKKYNSYSDNSVDIENHITHVSNNLDIICGIDSLFSEKNKISYEKVENLISELKDIYDLILIDTSSETAMKFIKIVLANVDKIIFLVEPNLLQIKKAESLLEIYIEDWEVYPKKIEILFNKVDGNSIDENILKEIFGKFKIIGKIHQSNKFTEIANDIRSEKFKLNKYMKILEKIS